MHHRLRTISAIAVLLAAATQGHCTVPARAVEDYLLPNGEPVVGVYYYPWYRGEPYGHVGWHPEMQYDNIRRPEHIAEVLRALADHGVNQASYSYWGDRSLAVFQSHIREAEKLLAQGWRVYLSPYMEPPTVDKKFAEPEAQKFTIERLVHFLAPTGRSPAFCRLAGDAFVNIYVAYYRPTETDDDLRAYLRARYGSLERLRRAWTMADYPPTLRTGAVAEEALPRSWQDITVAAVPRGTVAFADLQRLRARRLAEGWRKVMDAVRQQTGLTTRFTGDNSNTVVSPVQYMKALTGLTWYSFGYPLNNPFRRPKLISEIAKYTGTTFLYTIAPGYIDRQQRWPGFRLEHDPFYYEYGWVKALQTLPEGIMILTHSEWYEGSIIDVTREYGRRPYELTELYSSIFKAVYRDAFAHKRRRKPVAVVFNEWATYQLYDHGQALEDVYGLIKALECLSVDFDVIPESYLSADELRGRRLVLVPSCGKGLHPRAVEILVRWAESDSSARLVVDATEFWKAAAARPELAGRVAVAGERLGRRLAEAFDEAWQQGGVPEPQLRYMERLLTSLVPPRVLWAEGVRPSSSYEIARGPVVWAGTTAVVTAASTIPWGRIVHRRSTVPHANRTYMTDITCPWRRQPVTITVAMPPGRVPRQVQLLDSDAAPWTHAGDSSARLSWSYDPSRRLVSITTRCKFHVVLAVVTGPAALRAEGLEVYPGGEAVARVHVRNFTDRRLSGKLVIVGPPDLRAEPAGVSVAPRSRGAVAVRLRAGADCAVGTRTVKLVLNTDAGQAVVWARLKVSEPALLGLKTSVVAIEADRPTRAAVVVSNVGRQPARDVRVRVGEATASLPLIQPGEDAAVMVQVSPPSREEITPLPATVVWQAGQPPREDGLKALSGADGVTRTRRASGALGVEPDPTKPPNNMYIYFDVDRQRIPPGDYGAEAVVEFYDGSGSFIIEYDSALGDSIEDRYRDSARVALTGTGRWRTAVVELPHAHFAGRQNLGADLRISGRVLVRSLTLRPLTRRNRTVEVPVELRWKCGSGSFSTAATVRVVEIVHRPQRPEAVGEPWTMIWVGNPFGSAVPEAPVAVPLSDLPAALRSGPLAVYDAGGGQWPAEVAGGQLRAVVPLSDAEPLFIARGGPLATDLKVRDRAASLGYVAAENRLLAALWDARRGGTLVSLVSMAGKADYAADAGVCTVEYTLPDRSHHVSSSWPGTVRVASQSPTHADIVAVADGPAMTVTDRWRVYASCRILRLRRTIEFKKPLAATDFCPVVVRLQPRFFTTVFPLGVGFVKDGAPPRGWLETWHSEGWYFAVGGDRNSATDAVAVVVTRLDELRRVRYGFIPGDELPEAFDPASAVEPRDELQIRFRARCDYPAALPLMYPGLTVPSWWKPAGRQVYQPGQRLEVHALIAVARGLSWRFARELALCEKLGVSTAFGGSPPAGGRQVARLRRPLYMYRVHPPYPSAALEAQRVRDFAPEMALPTGD